ncbi:MAG: tetratricopeptide repeat protein [Bacteroidetes bacterium]|nr:MAG: tetratricopeptide repeat protein [Bacteroidota bacterium]
MAEQKDEPLVDVQETISKAEHYIEDNIMSLSIIVGAVIVLVGGYFFWTKFYIAPMEEEAQGQMFMAEKYFEKDSLDKAINGDGQFYGFKYIIENYGLTTSGNLAHMYLGLCYLNKGQFEDAIAELKEYDNGDDLMLGPVSIGAIGDAYSELGKTDDAIDQYIKASSANNNNFTTPIYLMKAATLYESQNKFEDALKIYEQVKTDFPESREGREVEKFISRAKAKGGIE